MTDSPETSGSDLAAQALEEAFAASRRWLDPPTKLRISLQEHGLELSSDEALPARLAAGYFLDFPAPGQRVDLVTMLETSDRPQLKPKHHHPAVAEFWAKLASYTKVSALQARLHDLLAQRGGQDVPFHANQSIAAYCDLFDNPAIGLALEDGSRTIVTWDESELDLGLARCFALFRYIRSSNSASSTEVGRAIDRALKRAEELAISGETPGVFMVLIEQLLLEKPRLDAHQQVSAVQLLERVFERSIDPTFVDGTGRILSKVLPARLDRVRERRVQVRLDRAASTAPMVAMSFLQQAQNLARDLGLSSLADEATRRMQALRTEDFGWQLVSTEATIGRELVEAQIGRWSQGATWQQAILTWGRSAAPTGDFASALEAATIRASEARLTNVISKVLYDADHLPRLTISTLEERVQHELSVSDRLALQLNGALLADALDRVARFGNPDPSVLLEWVSGADQQGRPAATNLVSALQAFWAKDFDVAIAHSIYQIEAGLRQLAMLLDEPAYIAVRKGTPGKYAGIDQLLTVLSRHDFDPDWDHAIKAFCLGPYGLNTRNDLAHGFPPTLSKRTTAALSIRMLLLVVLLGGKPDAGRSVETSTFAILSLSKTLELLISSSFAYPGLTWLYAKREVRDFTHLAGRTTASVVRAWRSGSTRL